MSFRTISPHLKIARSCLASVLTALEFYLGRDASPSEAFVYHFVSLTHPHPSPLSHIAVVLRFWGGDAYITGFKRVYQSHPYCSQSFEPHYQYSSRRKQLEYWNVGREWDGVCGWDLVWHCNSIQ